MFLADVPFDLLVFAGDCEAKTSEHGRQYGRLSAYANMSGIRVRSPPAANSLAAACRYHPFWHMRSLSIEHKA